MPRPRHLSPLALKIEAIAAARDAERQALIKLSAVERLLPRLEARSFNRPYRAREAKQELLFHRWLGKAPRELRDWRDIVKDVAVRYQLHPDVLLRYGKTKRVSHARHELYWLLFSLTRMSVNHISMRLGRDHTTLLHGIERHMRRNCIMALPPHRKASCLRGRRRL